MIINPVNIYEDILQYIKNKLFSSKTEGGKKNMCEILDQVENRGI